MSRVPFLRKYNVVYINWGFNYLNDTEVYTLLEKASHSLTTFGKDPGMIITKETTSKGK